MGPWQKLPLPIKVDLGVMTMNEYSTHPRSRELEPHHQMQFNVLLRTLLVVGGLTPLQRIQSVYSKSHWHFELVWSWIVERIRRGRDYLCIYKYLTHVCDVSGDWIIANWCPKHKGLEHISQFYSDPDPTTILTATFFLPLTKTKFWRHQMETSVISDSTFKFSKL